VGLSDELWSGVAVVAAPEVESLQRIGHAEYALWVFAVPMMVSAMIEAPVALASDRVPRPLLISAGLGALALALLLAALAPSAVYLAGSLALAGAASGIACGAAQAELVSRHPGGAHRAMSRWIAFSAAGDALTPLFVAGAYWAGGTHRTALIAVALILGIQALVSWRITGRAPQGDSAAVDEDGALVSLRTALASAARNPRLWLFLFGASACTLLDEVVVALAALRLHDDLGWSNSSIALALSGFSSGGVLGAIAGDRLLRRISPRLLLVGSTLGSIGLLLTFVIVISAPLAALLLFFLGMSASLHYPLVKAAAFELVPGQPGVVNALAQAFVGVEIVLPLFIGMVASTYGLTPALATLALEPIILLLVAAAWRKR